MNQFCPSFLSERKSNEKEDYKQEMDQDIRQEYSCHNGFQDQEKKYRCQVDIESEFLDFPHQQHSNKRSEEDQEHADGKYEEVQAREIIQLKVFIHNPAYPGRIEHSKQEQ